MLRLGLVGFAPAQEAAIKEALEAADHQPMTWKLATLADADAWCVNGSRIQVLGDGTVRIAHGLPSGRSLRINLAEMGRPIAFSSPLATQQVSSACVVDPESRESVGAMLKYFAGHLSPFVVQFYLASKVVGEHLDLKSSAHHVSLNGRLIAVVSLRGGIGVRPIADAALLANAVWARRPISADAIPSYFVRTDFSQLMWQYAVRTTRDWLPAHYRTSQLYLRRVPRVPLRMLDDHSLLLVRELGHASGTLSDLAQRTGMAKAQVSHRLAALYLVGAITASRDRAPLPHSIRDVADGHSALDSGPQPQLGLTVRLTIDTEQSVPSTSLGNGQCL